MAGKGILGPGNIPTILGAKPSHAESRNPAEQRGPILTIMKDESALTGRAGPIGSLKVIDDKWEHTGEKVTQFLSESNVDYQVVGVLGGPAVGKSTILNALYGLAADHPSIAAGRTAPPFPVQSDETKMLARHSSSGVELRVTAERLILLDSQPLLSPSVLTDITRPDGSASFSPCPGQSLSAEHALEIMALQQIVFLFSVCHVILLVGEGLEDRRLWDLLHAAPLLREKTFRPPSASLPLPPISQSPTVTQPPPELQRADPSSSQPTGSNSPGILGRPVTQPSREASQAGSRPGSAVGLRDESRRPGSQLPSTARGVDQPGAQKGPQRPRLYSPEVVFVATKLRGCELLAKRLQGAREELTSEFATWAVSMERPRAVRNGTFGRRVNGPVGMGREHEESFGGPRQEADSSRAETFAGDGTESVTLVALPAKGPNSAASESFGLSLRGLRDQVLGIPRKHLVGKPMTEASWLRYTNKVWKDVRESEAIREYCSMLRTNGSFR